MQEDARARIYDEYDKRNRKGVYAECTDPDSDDFYLTPEEKRKAIDEKLKKESAESPIDRNRAARERINAQPEQEAAPEPDQGDSRTDVEQARDAFFEKHPEYKTEAGWATLRKTALESRHPDVFNLRQKFDKTGNRADCGALLARTAEIIPGEKKLAEDRAAVEAMGLARFSSRGM